MRREILGLEEKVRSDASGLISVALRMGSLKFLRGFLLPLHHSFVFGFDNENCSTMCIRIQCLNFILRTLIQARLSLPVVFIQSFDRENLVTCDQKHSNIFISRYPFFFPVNTNQTTYCLPPAPLNGLERHLFKYRSWDKEPTA